MSEKPVSEWDKLILDLGEANAKVAAFERSNAERKDKLDAASDVISAQASTIAALVAALRKIASVTYADAERDGSEKWLERCVDEARAALRPWTAHQGGQAAAKEK